MPQLLKGLQTDTHPRNQIPGTWRDGLNFVVSDHPGSVSSEPGFVLLGVDYKLNPVGSVELGDGRTVVFSIDEFNLSEVGILTSTSYTTLLRDVVLNFNTSHPVTGEYQLTIKGEDIVAFTDNYNPPRLLNLSRLGFKLNPDKSLVDPAAFATAQLFAPGLPPRVELVDVFTGGQLVSGVYGFTVRYEDLSGFTTKWLSASRLVQISDDPVTGDYTQVDGAMPGSPTNKSIQIRLEGVDTRYSYIRLGVIKRVGGVTTAYEFNRLRIDSGSILFNHSGSESKIDLTVDEVLIPGPEFDTVRTLTQLNDELFVAGLTTKSSLAYQPYANGILVDYVSKDMDLKDPVNSYKNPKNTFYFKPFLHDEVYALYIVFKLKSGNLSDAYHIPGRPIAPINASWNTTNLLEDQLITGAGGDSTQPTFISKTVYRARWREDTVDEFGGPVRTTYFRYFLLTSGTYPEVTSKYSELTIDGVTINTNILYPDAFERPVDAVFYNVDLLTINFPVPASALGLPGFLNEDGKLGPNVKYFQTRNTADNPQARTNMGYWENQDEYYPDDESADVLNADGVLLNSFRKQRVRHHKMPSLRQHGGYSNGSDGKVKVLGVQIRNVLIPEHIKELVTGYEVYYAKRNYDNATIVGQSLLNFGSSVMQTGELSSGVTLPGFPNSSTIPPVIDGTAVSSTGGSWNYFFDENNTPDKWSMLRSDYIRMNPPDMLFNNARLSPTHITNQVLLGKTAKTRRATEDKSKRSLLIEVNHLDGSSLNGATSTYPVKDINYLARISDPQLIYHNTDPAGVYDNSGCETAFVAKVTQGVTVDYLGMQSSYPNPTAIGYVNDYTRRDKEEEDGEAKQEKYFSDKPAYLNGEKQYGGRFVHNYLTNLNVYRTNVYSAYSTQELVSTGFVSDVSETTSVPTFGGDSFFANYGMRLTAPNAVTFNTNAEYPGDPSAGIKVLYHYLVESVMNIGLRHQDLSSPTAGEQTVYYPKVGSSYLDEWLDLPLDRNLTIGYNSDYTVVNEYAKSYPYVLDRFVGYLPNRIHRSRITQREAQVSSWKNFPVNDYYDMPRNRGVITNLAALGSRLLIHTERSLYRTVNKTQLETSSVSVTLGSGDIFALEPEELIYGKSGYAGTTFQHACLVTKLGYFFPSQTGKVFLLGDKLDEVSNKGMSNFFREYLLNKPNDNPLQFDGVSCVWDEEYNRVLVTYNIDGNSWTLSYSGDLNAWAFRHSYTPGFYTSSGDRVLSIHKGKVYEHHKGLPGRYYEVNQVHSSSVDVVFNAPDKLTKLLQNVSWESEVHTPEGRDVFDETFDGLLIYTHQQCSGVLEVKHLEGGRMVEGTYFFNDFRDVVRDYTTPFMSDSILDKQVLLTGLNLTKAWYKQARFVGKYFVGRLIYSNLSGNHLSLHTVDETINKSNRV